MALLTACSKNDTGGNGTGPDRPDGSAAETTAGVNGKPVIKGDIDKKAILLVSSGTDYQGGRELSIEQIAAGIRTSFPEYELRQAYTSQIVLAKLKETEGLDIDDVETAMQKLVDEGFGTLVVQPTHVIADNEFTKMCEVLVPFTDYFVQMKTGQPLLGGPEDYQRVTQALISELISFSNNGVSYVLMGYGSDHGSGTAYSGLENAFREQGLMDYYVGIAEAEPGITEILNQLKETDTSKVILISLMPVASDPDAGDMAAEAAGSWQDQLTAAGYKVEYVSQGLGEYLGIREIYLAHIYDCMNSFSE